MSNKHRPRPAPQTPSQMPPRKFQAVLLEAPVDIARTPPPVVTDVNVTGEFECALVDFYYLPTEQFMEAVFYGEGVTQRAAAAPGIGTLRIPPVARVALPLQVSIELMLKILEMYVDSGENLKRNGPELLERLQRAFAALGALGATAVPPSAPSPDMDSSAEHAAKENP